MATVHRAIERGIEGFERVVALKRLLPHLAEDEGFVRAFVREAKLASLLQHGNIVQLYELGRVGPSYFISMEYIPGRDLRVILRQARRVCGPPPVEIALSIMTELLDALDYAHGQCGADGKPLGLVHRDISPSNLIVSHTGHLKVIDFGIAKATLGHLMTHTGRIKGKLSYMAPEALSGRTLDGRSDLFSASVIAHELLTATPLFAAKDDFQTIDRLQNMLPPPPSSRNPSCPPELDEIVLRGLTKDPTERWRSASEMRAALAGFAIDQHRLATNREVSEWVEEAFEMAIPSRMRLPLGPSSSAEARRGGHGEADDEIMDMVWGVTGPRERVVLDEVPDVSTRFSRTEPEAAGAIGLSDRDSYEPRDPFDPRGPFDPIDPLDPLSSDAFANSLAMAGEDEPTNAMQRPAIDPLLGELARPAASDGLDPRVSYRSSRSQSSQMMAITPPPPAEPETASANGQVSPNGRGRAVARPAEWALGTAPTTRQHEEMLQQAVDAARRASPAMAVPLPATTTSIDRSRTSRPSLVPLLLASIAVAAAGAAVAWIVSGGDGDPPEQVASAQPAAQVQPLDGAGATLPPQAMPPAQPAAASARRQRGGRRRRGGRRAERPPPRRCAQAPRPPQARGARRAPADRSRAGRAGRPDRRASGAGPGSRSTDIGRDAEAGAAGGGSAAGQAAARTGGRRGRTDAGGEGGHPNAAVRAGAPARADHRAAQPHAARERQRPAHQLPALGDGAQVDHGQAVHRPARKGHGGDRDVAGVGDRPQHPAARAVAMAVPAGLRGRSAGGGLLRHHLPHRSPVAARAGVAARGATPWPPRRGPRTSSSHR